jgi:nucleotide-binding universal stress UspA family protein
MMEKIVVGYDGSEHGDRALDRAAELAKGGAELIVVSAVPLALLQRGAGPAPGGAAVDPIESEQARETLDKARARLDGKGLNVRTVEAHGEAGDAVVRVAKDEGADLIVVGTRGRNVAQRAVLGSVSSDVVHHAECDVLVVR